MPREAGILAMSVCPSLGSSVPPAQHCGCRNRLCVGVGVGGGQEDVARQAKSWFLAPGVWGAASLTATLTTVSQVELWELIPKHTALCICFWDPSVQP